MEKIALGIEDNEMNQEESWTNLAYSWEDFICPERRLDSLLPWLMPVISARRPRKLVVDLCAGIGVEVAALAKMGIDIIPNEIDCHLSTLGRARCNKILGDNPLVHEWQANRWENLDQAAWKGEVGCALLLGNSFSLLLDRHEQEAALKAIAASLSHDGILMIDQRNFDFILNNRRSILSEGFPYSRRVMYCGHKIIGAPCEISDTKVTFSYCSSDSGLELGRLEVYPFKGTMLVGLAERAGLSLTRASYDLDICDARNSNWEFLTLVFRKVG